MTMTRAEIRIAAAKRREKQAMEAAARAREKKGAAVAAAARKHWPRIHAAERKCRAARAAVTLAELAAYGITPMETIIECTPAMEKRRGRYVVEIGHEGWARLLAVGKSGKVLAGRVDKQSPWKWSSVTVTAEKVKT